MTTGPTRKIVERRIGHQPYQAYWASRHPGAATPFGVRKPGPSASCPFVTATSPSCSQTSEGEPEEPHVGREPAFHQHAVDFRGLVVSKLGQFILLRREVG